MIHARHLVQCAAILCCIGRIVSPAFAAEQPLNIFVVGDSIAFGQGATEPSKSFAFLTYLHLRAAHPGSTITNHAVSGARIADVTRLELTRPVDPPDIIIVEAGANDVLRDEDAAHVQTNMEALLDAIRREFPRAKLIVCGIPDLSISPIFTDAQHEQIARRSRADNAAVHAAAIEHRATFVDVFELSQKLRGDAKAFLGSDNFHPSDKGHAAIAARIESAISTKPAQSR